MDDKEDFIKKIRNIVDINYQQSILYGIDFNNLYLNDDLKNNDIVIRNLCACFAGLFDVINKDLKNISYLLNVNPYLANLSLRYTSLKLSILNDEKLNLNNKLLLTTILDLISVYIYINKDTFDTKENYLNISLLHIKNNLNTYKYFFKENNVYDKETTLGPDSTDGFLQEFIVIGEVVKNLYENDNKLKNVK